MTLLLVFFSPCGACASRFLRNSAALFWTLVLQPRAGGFAANFASLLGGPLARLLLGLPRQSTRRRSLVAFALQRFGNRLGAPRINIRMLAALSLAVIALGAF